ncbi:hypothetical protein HDE_09019 [Halotydeus destructor]|nr:hypothetical protein HDE_09019 [Halotydeus destructor]
MDVRFLVFVTSIVISTLSSTDGALLQKCPGKKGKNCPAGQVCGHDLKTGTEQCGFAHASCKSKDAFYYQLMSNGKGKAVLKCIPKPGWRPDGSYWDESGQRYPNLCRLIPPPEKNWFAQYSKMFPCYRLTKHTLHDALAKKDKEKTTHGKCMWDYVLCFLYACYPGKDPMIAASKQANEVMAEAGR